MIQQAKGLLLAVTLLAAGSVCAADTTVFVDGRSGPWNIAVNPSFGYGVAANGQNDIHLGPTSVSSSSGLPFTVGDSLSIEYVSGSALAGANGSAWGSGANGVSWWPPSTWPCSGSPGCYTGQTTYLEQLLGTFANASGVIVGSPFALGNGPTLKVIPAGATQLLLGFNDGWYNDNGSGINVKVTEIAAVPEPESYAMLVAGLGLLAFFARRRTR
jgi:hypothetical protein